MVYTVVIFLPIFLAFSCCFPISLFTQPFEFINTGVFNYSNSVSLISKKFEKKIKTVKIDFKKLFSEHIFHIDKKISKAFIFLWSLLMHSGFRLIKTYHVIVFLRMNH